MKVLVCGGRDYNNERRLEAVLDELHESLDFTVLVNGQAKGADSLARRWGVLNGLKVKNYPADWERYGKSAGHLRNKYMLDDNPDIELVVAFPGGRGTAGMVALARSRKIDVIEVSE